MIRIMKEKKQYENLVFRIGLILILIGMSILGTYVYLPQNSIKNVISPSEINTDGTLQPQYIIIIQRNQFLNIKSECLYCNESIFLNITVLKVIGNTIHENRTIKFLSLSGSKTVQEKFALEPATYVLQVTLQGNFSSMLTIYGYGLPIMLIYTQTILIVSGSLLILVSKFKKLIKIT